MKKPVAVFLGLMALAAIAAAQIPERLDRALTAIYGVNEYSPESYGPVVWLENGTRYATVGSNGLIAYDTASGTATTLATPDLLMPAGITALTNGREPNIINGTSDWVNEEELFIRDAFTWSPDGRQIAYLQFDTSRVGRFTLVNYTDALYPALTEFAYPKVGTTNIRC
jgi:hypothetical protein